MSPFKQRPLTMFGLAIGALCTAAVTMALAQDRPTWGGGNGGSYEPPAPVDRGGGYGGSYGGGSGSYGSGSGGSGGSYGSSGSPTYGGGSYGGGSYGGVPDRGAGAQPPYASNPPPYGSSQGGYGSSAGPGGYGSQAGPGGYGAQGSQGGYGAQPSPGGYAGNQGYAGRPDDAYRPQGRPNYEPEPYPSQGGSGRPYDAGPGYGTEYSPPRRDAYNSPPPSNHDEDQARDGTFSSREIVEAGHGFFGSVSQGLASVIEYAFQKQGRPNGYILGEDVGGAFVAGLRYGEGRLFTKDAGTHKVYWQGPSIGYDAGAEGSKVMVLVYNLREPSDIYERFGGVAGSAYIVGGVGLTFQSNNDVVLAPIRSGIGLRLGANIGYLKYTRRPTWNPF